MNYRAKILLILFVWILFTGGCGLSDNWQHERGIVFADGFRQHSFSDGPGELFTQFGHRRIRKEELQEISVYHAVILVSDHDLEPGRLETTRSHAQTLTTLFWRSKGLNSTVSKSIEFKYDGRSKILAIAGQEFSTSEKNMFIVSVDRNWIVSAAQVDGFFESRANPHAVLLKFKEVTDRPEIQELEVSGLAHLSEN
jgi:hypothetical protein